MCYLNHSDSIDKIGIVDYWCVKRETFTSLLVLSNYDFDSGLRREAGQKTAMRERESSHERLEWSMQPHEDG